MHHNNTFLREVAVNAITLLAEIQRDLGHDFNRKKRLINKIFNRFLRNVE